MGNSTANYLTAPFKLDVVTQNHIEECLVYLSGYARKIILREYFNLYQTESEQRANLYLLHLKMEGSVKTKFETPADKLAFECAEIIRIGGSQTGYEFGEQFFIENGLTVPTSPLGEDQGKVEAIIARMIDPDVWARKLKKKHRQNNAGAVYRSAGNNVCRGGEVYCPDFVVDDYIEQQKDSASFLASQLAISNENEEVSLADIIASTVANPENRRYEMTTRMAGMEDFTKLEADIKEGISDKELVLFAVSVWLLYVSSSLARQFFNKMAIEFKTQKEFLKTGDEQAKLAELMGFVCIFFTLTSPSKYHRKRWLKGANDGKGRAIDNPNFQKEIDGVKNSPRVALNQQAGVKARTRSKLKRDGIDVFGFSVVEPHHDGCPHQHLAVFVRPEDADKVKQVFRHYALEEDGDELGAKTQPKGRKGESVDPYSTRRLDILNHDPKKGTVTAYMAKYISKGIAGFGIGEDFESGLDCDDSVLRVLAWKSLWGFRQFSFFGAPSVTLWRELRKVKEPFANETAEKIRLACDDGDWGEFTQLMQKHDIKLKKANVVDDQGEEIKNKYGEPLQRVVGIIVSDVSGIEIIRTRFKEWFLIDVEKLEERIIDGLRSTIGFDEQDIDRVENMMHQAKEEKKVHRLFAGTGGVVPDAVRYFLPDEGVYFYSTDNEPLLFSTALNLQPATLGVRVL